MEKVKIKEIHWASHFVFWPWLITVRLFRRAVTSAYITLMGCFFGKEGRMKLRNMDDDSPNSGNYNSFGSTDSACQNCEALQKALIRSNRTIKDLQDKNDWLINEQRKSSDELTKQMAKRLEEQQLFENASDPLSNMKLSARFKAIKDGKFHTVSEGLEQAGIGEVDVIHRLIGLMKKAYTECCDRADQQIRVCLRLENHEPIPSPRKNRYVYRLRFKVDSQDDKKAKIVSEIVSDVMKDASFDDVDVNPKTLDQLQTFLTEFTDCVWLMTIVEDRLALDFDALTQRYTGDLAKCFETYTPQEDVPGPPNTVMAVVWPCVNKYTGGDLMVKGEVLVSNKLDDTEV